MVKYSFTLKNKNTNKEHRYAIELNKDEENMPEQFFTSAVCDRLKNELQKQSGCRLNESDLSLIIATWIEDIKEGYRNSTIALNLPFIKLENLDNLQPPVNKNLPNLISPNLADIEPKLGAMPPLDFC
jgi:hypothetical protein